MINRNQFAGPRVYINPEQTIMPRIGINGTSGVRKGLGRSGLVLRRTIMPMQTMTNANSVPITVISEITEAGTNAATSPVKTKKRRLDFHGVLKREWSWENTAGTNPSFDMEKNTRDCPISITRITEENPARIATVTKVDKPSIVLS